MGNLFGARYYDARTSVWQSTDPAFYKGEYFPTMPTDEDQLAELQKGPYSYWKKNLPGMGGVFNSPNMAMYTYGHNNPVRMFDPDGNDPLDASHAFDLDLGADYIQESIKDFGKGNNYWGTINALNGVAEFTYDTGIAILSGGASAEANISNQIASQASKEAPVALSKTAQLLSKHKNILEKFPMGGAGNNALKNKIANSAVTLIKTIGTKGPIRHHARWGKIYDIKIPGGIGARFSAKTNELIHFLGKILE